MNQPRPQASLIVDSHQGNTCDKAILKMTQMVVKFQEPVNCYYCKYAFNISRALQQHMESDHDSDPSFPCMKCPKLFKSEGEAFDHFVNQHNIYIQDISSQARQAKKESTDIKDDNNTKPNYVLNELKNVKTAKANAKRKPDVDRELIDDMNLKYKVNSAVFLVFKEEMDRLVQGYIYCNDDLGWCWR